MRSTSLLQSKSGNTFDDRHTLAVVVTFLPEFTVPIKQSVRPPPIYFFSVLFPILFLDPCTGLTEVESQRFRVDPEYLGGGGDWAKLFEVYSWKIISRRGSICAESERGSGVSVRTIPWSGVFTAAVVVTLLATTTHTHMHTFTARALVSLGFEGRPWPIFSLSFCDVAVLPAIWLPTVFRVSPQIGSLSPLTRKCTESH